MKVGFGSYLMVLLSGSPATKELTISHLDSVICTLRSELRLQLAMEVSFVGSPLKPASQVNYDHKKIATVTVYFFLFIRYVFLCSALMILEL